MATPKKKVAPVAAVQHCGNCRFYKPKGDAGICQRYPASVIVEGDGAYSVRPIMEPTEWCGEHQGNLQ